MSHLRRFFPSRAHSLPPPITNHEQRGLCLRMVPGSLVTVHHVRLRCYHTLRLIGFVMERQLKVVRCERAVASAVTYCNCYEQSFP